MMENRKEKIYQLIDIKLNTPIDGNGYLECI